MGVGPGWTTFPPSNLFTFTIITFEPAVRIRKFNVVAACYGTELTTDYEHLIDQFKVSYLNLCIPVTPKVHAVIFHVPEFCTQKSMGLGPWSEQTSESIHHDFKLTWINYLIKDLEHPRYGDNLLRALQMYNSQHL